MYARERVKLIKVVVVPFQPKLHWHVVHKNQMYQRK
jgi:hypothetical protein